MLILEKELKKFETRSGLSESVCQQNFLEVRLSRGSRSDRLLKRPDLSG